MSQQYNTVVNALEQFSANHLSLKRIKKGLMKIKNGFQSFIKKELNQQNNGIHHQKVTTESKNMSAVGKQRTNKRALRTL